MLPVMVTREAAGMSTEMRRALASDAAEADANLQARREFIEAVFTGLFAAAAIVGASLLAVVTGLV
jgi:nitrogen fixation/metabolism regulation signal transduction histidine kinase